MFKIGYSTGSIAKENYEKALQLLSIYNDLNSVELSALREEELEKLINDFANLELTKYSFISIHLPSKLNNLTESYVLELVRKVSDKNIFFVVHPDIITDYNKWTFLNEKLCVENMDKRKQIGRTSEELEEIFIKLPNASFCFDIAHARQVDSTMHEATNILKKFASRLKEIHISEVNSQSKHETMSIGALYAYKSILHLIPEDIPIIIESIVDEDEIESEVRTVRKVFNVK